jgi:NAD(P)-dependent dehydrogenase (short-subunit alcohol dehydrogenase family)
MGKLNGRVALVTGAAGGLGRVYAEGLAREGASVVVNDYNAGLDGVPTSDDRAGAVVEALRSLGADAVVDRHSVADWNGARAMIATALDAFGRLDIVVNNAGVNHQHRLATLTREEMDVEIDVHLKGTLAVSHFAAAHWLDVGPAAGRAVINTTSAAGLHPTAGAGVYAAAKAGIAALTIAHAQELAGLGVRVNAVAPCARTRMVEGAPTINAMMPTVAADAFDRHLPDHVAPLVVYLASDDNRFTGRVFAIEGPDLALYQPPAVISEWSTNGPWTHDALVAVFGDVAPQVTVRAFVPQGAIDVPVPPGRTLRDLTAPPSPGAR